MEVLYSEQQLQPANCSYMMNLLPFFGIAFNFGKGLHREVWVSMKIFLD
jgi:hypothetical protein